MIGEDGFVIFDADTRVSDWAQAARRVMEPIASDAAVRAANLRHGKTWFVGVDILPNGPDGAVSGGALRGPWEPYVPKLPQHRAQVSIIYPGYPRKDVDESAANHRYRVTRCAAHVDGLLPEGPARRRYAREYHAYLLGLPLNPVSSAPTVVWRGSHWIMQEALSQAIGDRPVGTVDLTDVYHAARRRVFESCEMVPLQAVPGQSYLLHRFALHGTAPWEGPAAPGRMVAFLRPEFEDPKEWCMS